MGYKYVKSRKQTKKSLELVLYGQALGFDCRTCKKANLCESRGCIEGIPSSSPYLYGDEKIWKCPLTFYNEEIAQAVVLYGAYKNGFLPDQGGILDQTARFSDYMELIGEHVKEREEQELQKRQREMKRKK